MTGVTRPPLKGRLRHLLAVQVRKRHQMCSGLSLFLCKIGIVITNVMLLLLLRPNWPALNWCCVKYLHFYIVMDVLLGFGGPSNLKYILYLLLSGGRITVRKGRDTWLFRNINVLFIIPYYDSLWSTFEILTYVYTNRRLIVIKSLSLLFWERFSYTSLLEVTLSP